MPARPCPCLPAAMPEHAVELVFRVVSQLIRSVAGDKPLNS